jgi:adenylate cyclase class 1
MELEQVTRLITSHNRSRLERLWALAPQKQKTFFELLPLIFHTNDDALPAFVPNAPIGIRGYQPSDQLLAETKKYNPGFSQSHRAFTSYPLEGLYLLNENGELSYPKQPKFGLWLVYKDSNNQEQIDKIKQKMHELLTWAETLGVKLSARLLNESAVIAHSVSSDDLDIFYSSGLVVAGAIPVWSYLKPEQLESYQDSVNTITNTLSNDIFTIDFGPLTTRTPTSVIDKAVEANLNCMHNNLPSYLELLFYFTLLENGINSLWLADEHKRLIFSHQNNSFLYDPNILKLGLITKHLSYELQLWAQRSLYLKCQERLSIPVSYPEHPWRRDNLSDLIKSWQWHNSEIGQLDKRSNANMRARLDEFAFTKKLTGDFNQRISQFILEFAPNETNKRKPLQQTYEEIFDTAPGVISRLPESLIPDSAEAQLFLLFDSKQHVWLINDKNSDDKATTPAKPLYASSSLIQTLAWAISNGALSKYTQVKLMANNGVISTDGIHSLISYLHKSPLGAADSTSAKLTWLMFANMHDTPKEAYKQQDAKLSLYQRDPLNYGYHRRNMVLDIEVLAYENGQKWHYFKYEDNTAATETLANLIRWQQHTDQSNYIDSWCPTNNFSSSIIKRLNTLAENVIHHYQQSNNNGKYMFEIADRTASVNWQDGIVEDRLAAPSQNLADELARPTSAYTNTRLDQLLDRDGLYSLLLKSYRNNRIQVFIDGQKAHVNLFIIDELGHVFKQTFQGLRENTLINNFNDFLTEVNQRNNLEQTRFYTLKNTDGVWSTLPITLETADPKKAYLPVKVKMREPTLSSDCTISCGQQQFRGKANDAQLFHQVYELVNKLRNSNINYPLYISNISFVGEKPFSSYHYITFKQRLEKILNFK